MVFAPKIYILLLVTSIFSMGTLLLIFILRGIVSNKYKILFSSKTIVFASETTNLFTV